MVSTMMVLGVVALGVSIFSGHERVVQAGEDTAITAKELPKFNAVAYIAGHGGHLAILDLRTMVPPVDPTNWFFNIF